MTEKIRMVKVSETTWQRLMYRKIKRKNRSLNDVIDNLLTVQDQ